MIISPDIRQKIEPYIDVLLFVVCLIGAHFFWKFTVDADEMGGPVFWFGMNISAPFDYLSRHIAHATYDFIHSFRDTIHFYEPYTLRYDSGSAMRIVWSCTGLKQSFIWLVIMLAARGSWKKKLWFIPLGWLCIYSFNLIRIFIISIIMEFHPEYFHFLHSYLFKYLFYGMLFLLWVWWVEKISKAPNTQRQTSANGQVLQ